MHISNVHTREEFRHTSVTVPVCNGQVVGLGLKGYLYAMEAVVDMVKCKAKEWCWYSFWCEQQNI